MKDLLREFIYIGWDLKSPYKSLWLGPVCIVWNFEWPERHFSIGWRPT